MSRTRAEAPSTEPAASPAGPPSRPRRTQAERSETTRQKLIDATVKLLRCRGYGGLRTVEISEVAGVSRGAQMHHFPTKDTLVTATVQYLNHRMLERSRQRAQAAREGGDPIGELIEDACDFFFGDYFFITLAVNISDERNEALKRVAQSLMAPSRFEVEREWQAVLEESGLPRDVARDALTLTLSMVRGFGVRTLLVESPDRFASELALWRSMLEAHVRTRLESAAPKTRAKVAPGPGHENDKKKRPAATPR